MLNAFSIHAYLFKNQRLPKLTDHFNFVQIPSGINDQVFRLFGLILCQSTIQGSTDQMHPSIVEF